MKPIKQPETPTEASKTSDTPRIRILRIGSCPSLSAKSTLTYHVGYKDETEIMFRVYANSGGGFFGQEWISLSAIQQAFAQDKPITSRILNPLFNGKSVNTPAFLFAVLKHEGLVMSLKGKRSYERSEPTKFMDEVKELIESTVDLEVEDKSAKANIEAHSTETKAKPIKKSAAKSNPKEA